MPRDKSPSLSKTCLICRQKLISSLKIKDFPRPVPGIRSSPFQKWKALCLETLSMLFGLPEDHPLTLVFSNSGGSEDELGAKMCNRCLQEVSNVYHVFWQLQGLEKKLTELQVAIFGRLRSNYESLPVDLVLGRYMGVDILRKELHNLKYDEIVKILFEEIKGNRDAWPRHNYTERWKQACETADTKCYQTQGEMDTGEPPPVLWQDVSAVSTDHVKIEVEPVLDPSSFDLEMPEQPQKVQEEDVISEVYEDSFDDEAIDEDEDMEMYEDDELYEPTRKGANRANKKARSKPKVKVIRKSTKCNPPKDAVLLCTEDPENCTRTYRTKKLLRDHIAKFHRAKKFSCGEEGCSAKFKTEDQILSHKAKFHSIPLPKVVCELCGLAMEQKELRKHFLMRHHGQGKYKCERCSLDFMEAEELQAHENLHATAEYPFLCVVCQQLFTNSMDLKNHVVSNHLSSGLKCPICGLMKPNEFQLQRHIKVHERVKQFTCETCGRQFASRAYLNYHVDHYHTNQGRKYPCEICGKEFLHQKNVLRHLISHQEDKPYKCKICPKMFNYSHLLKKHEEIHSGTKNYECHLCGKRFRQEQNLKQHMKSHQPKPDRQGGRRKIKSEEEDESVGEISYEIHHTEGENKEQIPVILQVKGDIGLGTGDTSGLVATTTAEGQNVIEATIIPAADMGENGHVNPGAHYETVQEIQLTAQDLAQSQTATVVFLYEYQA